MSEKFKVLTSLVELAEKLGYVVKMISSFSEELCLYLENKQKRFHVFIDLEDTQSRLIRQVLLEKGNNPPEEKYYSSLSLFQNALRSGK